MRKTSTPTVYRAFLLFLLNFLFIGVANAQDLAAGIKAPSNVKVDGKLTEWTVPLLYNKSTMLHYTVANDAQTIYLALTSTDQSTINKILANGITIVLNKDGKKRDKDALVLVYPVPNRGAGRGGFGGRPGGAGGGGNRGGGGGGGNRQAGQDKIDTVALIAAHKRSITAAKEFRITGVKSITDTTVSIYNTYGLKTVINFDAKANLVYEIAIPLSMLELTSAQQTELAFNIKVNGVDLGGAGMVEGTVMVESISRAGGGGIRIGGSQSGIDMFSATDFWGKYKLIK